MARRILALIKKDLRFNWKIIIGILIGVTIFIPLNWVEYKIEGVWDVEYKWLWCWFIAAAGLLSVNPSLNIEQGVSTKVFLAALPFTLKELFLSKIIENVVYTILCAGILTAGILFFACPVELQYLLLGMPVSIFCNTIYASIYYLANFNKAQIFAFSALLIPEIVGGWMKVDFDVMAFFTNHVVSVGASAVMLVLSLIMIVLMCMKKRRLL